MRRLIVPLTFTALLSACVPGMGMMGGQAPASASGGPTEANCAAYKNQIIAAGADPAQASAQMKAMGCTG